MLQHFLIVALLLPWLIAAGAAGVLLHRTGRGHGRRLAELGIGAGFLGGYAALAGGLPFLDSLPDAEIGEAAVLATGAAFVLALWGPGARLGFWLIAACAALLALWLVGGWSFVFLTSADIATAAIGVLAALLIVWRLSVLAAAGGAGVLLVLAVMALGEAAVARLADARFFADLFLAFAASLLGLLVWAWPPGRWAVGPAGLLLGAAFSLALALPFWHDALLTPWALPVAGLGLWADRIVAAVPVLARLHKRKPWRPAALAAAAALPALLAVGLAALLRHLMPSA